MGLSVAVAPMYFLLPLLAPSQLKIIQYFHPEMTEELYNQAHQEICYAVDSGMILEQIADSGFYYDEDDSISENMISIEDLESLNHMKTLEELENPEFGPQSEGSGLVTGEDESGAAESFYLDSIARLRLFEYGEEQFSVSRSSSNSNLKNLISVNSKTFTNRIYDDKYKLVALKVYQNSSSVADSKILKQVTYFYQGENFRPRKILEEFPQKKQKVVREFDDAGNPVLVINSHFIDDPDEVAAEELRIKREAEEKRIRELAEKLAAEGKTPDEVSEESDEEKSEKEEPVAENSEQSAKESKKEYSQKEVLDKKTLRTFNSDKKITSEEETLYVQEPDPLRKGKTKTITVVKKNIFIYTKKSAFPDLEHYENGVLRIKQDYIDESTYLQTIYHEGGVIIETKYSDGKKLEEKIKYEE